MTFHFCGYFPKLKTPRPADYDLPGVVEIASVSQCQAKGPEKWIESWSFNELGFFNTVELAEAIVPEADRSQYELYAYELLDERFAEGVRERWPVPRLDCTPPRSGFTPIGFDAVSRSTSDFFECSPLSCNGAATTYPANAYCLFDELQNAVTAAQEFSAGTWEPGPYYVVRVLRRSVESRL